jgi:hypothetical protein
MPVRLTESYLRNIVKEEARKLLKENPVNKYNVNKYTGAPLGPGYRDPANTSLSRAFKDSHEATRDYDLYGDVHNVLRSVYELTAKIDTNPDEAKKIAKRVEKMLELIKQEYSDEEIQSGLDTIGSVEREIGKKHY